MNQDYKNGLKSRVKSCQSCEELKDVIADITSTLQSQTSDITDQLEKLQPYLALLEAPTSPDAVVDWVKGLIDTLIKPLTTPIVGYQLQLAEYAALTVEITQEVNDKIQTFTDCEVS